MEIEKEIHESFGLYTGEPGPVEILQRKAYRTINGPDHLAIKKVCPACHKDNAVWVRNEWNICYTCEMAFTNSEADERYTDLTEDEEMEETNETMSDG